MDKAKESSISSCLEFLSTVPLVWMEKGNLALRVGEARQGLETKLIS